MKTWLAFALVGTTLSGLLPARAAAPPPPAVPAEVKIAAAQAAMAKLCTALMTFEVDNARFPTSVEGLRALVDKPNKLPNWKGPYADRAALIDPWKRPYVFKYPGATDRKTFDLSSNGPDGKPGTGDDVPYLPAAPAK